MENKQTHISEVRMQMQDNQKEILQLTGMDEVAYYLMVLELGCMYADNATHTAMKYNRVFWGWFRLKVWEINAYFLEKYHKLEAELQQNDITASSFYEDFITKTVLKNAVPPIVITEKTNTTNTPINN